MTPKILLSGAMLSLSIAAFSQSNTPNVIYILADDLGYGDLGCYGQKLIQTPEIDKMAEEGIKFSQHYSGSTVCAPSRCVLMTGLHSGNAYVRGNKKLPLRPEDYTVAELFKEHNYTTACIGKWGIGDLNTTGHPNVQGFDHFFGYLDQVHAHTYFTDHLIRNSDTIPLDGETYSHDLLTQEAIEFITQNKDTSFFLYLPYTIPHTKFQVPSEGIYADSTHWQAEHRIQAAMISRMDRDVGRILDTLAHYGIAENTLVIFTSDNGAHGQSGTLNFFDASGDLRGKKRDLYEGGVRVPFIAKWPGKITPNTESDHVSTFWDFLPTVSDLFDAAPPEGLDGISMLPALLNGSQQEKHDFLYWEFHEQNGKQAIRLGDWKGIRLNVYNDPNSPIELYNIKDDIGEQTNLAQLYPDIVNRIDFIMKSERSYSEVFDFTYGSVDITSLDIFTATGAAVVAPNDTLQINYHVSPATASDKRCTWSIIEADQGVTAEFTEYGELIAGSTKGWIKLAAVSVADSTVGDTLSIEITNKPVLTLQLPEKVSENSVSISVIVSGSVMQTNKTGFVYGSLPNPDLKGTIKDATIEEGWMTTTLENLPFDTTIFIRAFVVTETDTVFSQQESITLYDVDLGEYADNILLYLPLDNDFLDYSKHQHTITVSGDPVRSSDAKHGNSMVFDGVDDYLQTPSGILDPAATDFTLCAWLKAEDNSTTRIFVQQEDGGGKGRSIVYISGNQYASFLGGKGYTTTASYNLSEWVHVALVGTKTMTRFYVNGEAEAEFAVVLESSKGELNIGSFKLAQGNSRNWIGSMDEIYLLDTALAKSDIQKFVGYKLSGEKLNTDDYIKVFPNPSPGIIHIEGISGDYMVSVYTLSGQKVYSAQHTEHNNILTLDKLIEGLYLIEIRNAEYSKTKKLIILP